MTIVDLTPDYWKFLSGEASFEEYRTTNMALFDHYLKFWSDGENLYTSFSFEEVKARQELIVRHLIAADERLQENGFLTEDLSAILFVGDHSANGHAFLDNGKPVAWFAIECFATELEAKIFTLHELIHALHYAARPEFAFNTMEQKRYVSRQLISEGIATYLTKRLWNVNDDVALWADKLSPAQLHSWMTACQNSEKELFQFVAANFDSSDPSIHIFHAANPKDIYSYRAGYYAGLKLIESIALDNNFNDLELINTPLAEMKQLVWNTL